MPLVIGGLLLSFGKNMIFFVFHKVTVPMQIVQSMYNFVHNYILCIHGLCVFDDTARTGLCVCQILISTQKYHIAPDYTSNTWRLHLMWLSAMLLVRLLDILVTNSYALGRKTSTNQGKLQLPAPSKVKTLWRCCCWRYSCGAKTMGDCADGGKALLLSQVIRYYGLV